MNFPRLLAALPLLLVAAGCNQAPEDFCEGWVRDTCTTLAGCCVDGAPFDENGCKVGLTQFCQSALAVEEVHSGEVVFDSGAASTCFGKVETCGQTAEPTDEQAKACGNMVTGHRPPGAACNEDRECERGGGDYPKCHQGVCAKAIISTDATCGFSFATLELKVCPTGQSCDTSGLVTDPQAPPSSTQWEFSAPCLPPLGAGAACLDQNGDPVGVCGFGLYCDFDFMAPENSTCTAELAEGADCSMGGVCGPNLQCDFGGSDVCEQQQGSFCYEPPVCGDGNCEQGEDDVNCAADCGPQCGDGFCDPPEDDVSCPADCGGGPGCGDGVCDFNGTEPVTCPADCCGDGFCDPGEDPVCPADCA